MGWDGVDEFRERARLAHGDDPGLFFRHHRKKRARRVGARARRTGQAARSSATGPVPALQRSTTS
jgi:hypothetical protein